MWNSTQKYGEQGSVHTSPFSRETYLKIKLRDLVVPWTKSKFSDSPNMFGSTASHTGGFRSGEVCWVGSAPVLA